jgi:hypothetical protein
MVIGPGKVKTAEGAWNIRRRKFANKDGVAEFRRQTDTHETSDVALYRLLRPLLCRE